MFLDHPPSLSFPQSPPLEDPPRQPLLLRKVLHCSFYFEARNVKTKSYFLLLLPVLATWAGSFSSSLEFVFFVKTSLDAVHHCHNHLLMLIIVKNSTIPPFFSDHNHYHHGHHHHHHHLSPTCTRNPTSWPLSQTPFIFSSSLTITPWQSQSQWSGEKLMIKVWSICLNVSVCENLSRATLPCRSPLANSPSYVSLADLSSQHDLINVLNPHIGSNLIHQIIRSSAFCCWERCESALTYQQ